MITMFDYGNCIEFLNNSFESCAAAHAGYVKLGFLQQTTGFIIFIHECILPRLLAFSSKNSITSNNVVAKGVLFTT